MSKGHDVLEVEIVNDDAAEFFAPVSSDLIDGLLGQYQTARQSIAEVSAYVNGPKPASVIHYFLSGNVNEERGILQLKRSSEQLFDEKGAVSALNSAYWSKTMSLTDVYDAMPQKRRNEWNESIRNPLGKKKHKSRFDDSKDEWEVEPLPEYTEDTVRATISGLLSMRAQFLSERVDGIFRGLSGEHVTNAPEAFGKRMIISRVLGAYGFTESSTSGLINDLRCVIAKFMGRDEPGYQVSSRLIDTMKGRWGQWVVVDGGAMKVRLYKKGTAHMEVHPDMAWRLNSILSHMHPLAIPAEFRQKPKKRTKEFAMMARPLPFRVLEVLADAKQAKLKTMVGFRESYSDLKNTITMSSDGNKDAYAEAVLVLESIGGAKVSPDSFEFDYSPLAVIREIVTSGCIPDQKAHQFYPTPAVLAAMAVSMAEIQPGDRCLEPSAGQGGIAKYMPADTVCVEISPLNATVLKTKGFANVVEADFMAWRECGQTFDVVAMNPPFSQGRAKEHTQAAAELLAPGGRLVAILPASHHLKMEIPGCTLEWSKFFSNAFEGTSVSVVIMKATKVKK